MKGLKRFLSICLVAVLALGLCGSALAAEEGGEEFTLGIYTTTDMAGKCWNEDPLTETELPDSFLKVADVMEKERRKNDATLLLDNGGLLQGTSMTLCNLYTENGVKNPMALCLRYCGYDAFSLRGHEFLFQTELRDAFCQVLEDKTSNYPGAPVSVLCANEIEEETQQIRTTPYVVRSFQAFQRQYRVGVLSFDAVERSGWDLPKEYDGIDFVHKDNRDRSLGYEWTNYWQKRLREEEKCDFVILMLPFGRGGGQEASGGVEQGDRVAQLIQSTTGIDMVVAGRDMVSGATAIRNREGKAVAVVNGGGSAVTKTVVKLRDDGSMVVAQNELLPLAGYEDDKTLKGLMRPYYKNAASFVEQSLCVLGRGWDRNTSHYFAPDNTTNLFHEVQLWATGADLSILSPAILEGVTVAPLWKGDPTNISLKDLDTLFPNGDYSLYTVELTGRQLKDWLERCAATYQVTEDGKLSGGGWGTDQIAGLHYEIYVGNPVGSRVENMTYQDRPVTENQVFRTAVGSYRLGASAAGDEYGWYAATGVTLGSEKIVWDSTRSFEFGMTGGSFLHILAEYARTLGSQGRRLTVTDPKELWILEAGESAQVLKPVTRLEMIHELYRRWGGVFSGSVAPFSDVANDPAVNWAYETGVARGNGSGQFLPDEVITREQAIVMIFRYDKMMGRVPEKGWQAGVSYTDAAKTSVWSADALMWNGLNNYLTPDTENYLHPDEKLTAGELEAALRKMK